VISDIYVKEWLANLEVLGVECVWVEIKISKNHPVLIGTFYRPPDEIKSIHELEFSVK
jgi:hypothetical protein